MNNFKVIVENNNGKQIIDYLVSCGYKNTQDFVGDSINSSTYCVINGMIKNGYMLGFGYVEYTLEDIKEIHKNNVMEQEIYEYQVKEEFYKLSEALFSECKQDSKGGFGRFDVDSNVKDFYEKAGVLGLWFEPRYKKRYKVGDIVCNHNPDKGNYWNEKCKDGLFVISEVFDNRVMVKPSHDAIHSSGLLLHEFRLATQEEIEKFNTQKISMNGKFDLTIKNNRVYHESEDITDYVLEMKKWFESLPQKFGRWAVKFDDVIFNETGCQQVITTIKDWEKIYTKIK